MTNKKLELYNQFNSEYQKYSHYLKVKLFAKIIFSRIINQIIKIDYNRISLEFTPSNSFLFNILIHAKQIYIEIYLSEFCTAYSAIYGKDKHMLYNGYGRLRQIIKDIKDRV